MKIKYALNPVLAILFWLPSANAQTIVNIPQKDKDKPQVPVTRPKAPSNQFITMYCYPSDGLIAFAFSESIGYIDVTIINENTGETYISEVTHENPSMNVTLTHDCPYLVNCITDTGSIFETTISL